MSLQEIALFAARRTGRQDRRSPTVGLVNLMPDAAFAATEAQFRGLLTAASGEPSFRLELFTLPELDRKGAVLADMRHRYRSVSDLLGGEIDGLIVTGTEPKHADLRAEVYWPALCQVIDWAADHTRSAVFSCLAAHAAVLHLDGPKRRRLPGKLTGLMACTKTGPHWATDGLPERWLTPHSRWNDLAESELAERGYRLLTRAEGAGADLFVKPAARSQFVFMQGHPEYGGDGLIKEYRRDVRRFLAGEAETYPQRPQNVFEPDLAAKLDALAARARATRDADIAKQVSRLLVTASHAAPWRPQAVQFYRNWLAVLDGRTQTLQPATGEALPL